MDHVDVMHGRHKIPQEIEVTDFVGNGQACPGISKVL